jgi:hypothetical protein
MHVLNDGNIKLQGRVQDDGNESGVHLSITAFQHARARFAKHNCITYTFARVCCCKLVSSHF